MADDNKKKKGLLESDSEDEQEKRLLVNKRYAKAFELRKQRQELRNAIQDGIDVDAGDNDSSSSSEDEDGELLTTKLDTDIIKTLNALRSKDKAIYDPDKRFFNEEANNNEEEENDVVEEEKKDKRKKYKDVVREQILEDMEKGESTDAAGEQDPEAGGKQSQLAYDDEQRQIRQAFLESTAGESGKSGNGENEDDGDDLMVVKKRIKGSKGGEDDDRFQQEIEKLEADLNNRGNDETTNIVDPKGEVKDGEKFLLNFFRKRNWVDQNDRDTDSSDDEGNDKEVTMKQARVSTGKDGNESEDSLEQLEKNDDFEARYNFRFEAAAAAGSQSGADFSNVGYARGQTMDTLRRKDDSRKEKRLARKERKEAERRAKEEQLKRLKNAKRKEMETKLQEIKKVLGDVDGEEGGEVAVDEAAILKMMEGDFDPDKLEKEMQEAFGDDFYQKQDAKWKSDQDVRNDLKNDEDGELLVGEEGEGHLYDDENQEEDEEEEAYEGDDNEIEEPWVEEGDDAFYGEEDTKEESELEKKIKSKMQEELYKLDYEDIVAGMPTRFKYREVEPNNFGLSTQEILFARDNTLRQYVSLKKLAPYREDGEHKVGRKKRHLFREMLERDLEETEQSEAGAKEASESKDDDNEPMGDSVVAAGEEGSKKKKRKRSKKTKSSENDETNDKASAEGDEKVQATEDSEEPKKKRKRRRKKHSSSVDDGERTASEKTASEETEIKEAASSPVEEHPPSSLPEKEAGTEPEKEKETIDKESKPEKSRKSKHSSSSREKKSKKKKKSRIEGISTSRLESYGLS